MIIGHRGARAEAPENTPGGFKYLQSLDIQSVELDIQLSKDNELVIIHDKTTDRTSNDNLIVREQTLNELKQLNYAHRFNNWQQEAWHQAESVLSLDELLEGWKGLEHIQIEVKPAPLNELEIIADRTCELIEKLNLHQQAVITTSDANLLKILTRYPNYQKGLVAQTQKQPIELALEYNCNLLALNYTLATKKFIEQAKQNQLPISCWTVNDSQIAKQLLNNGVSSIITDYPQKFLNELKQSS